MAARLTSRTESQAFISQFSGISDIELPSTQEWHSLTEQIRLEFEHQKSLVLTEVAFMQDQLRQEFAEVEHKCAAMILAQGQKADDLHRQQQTLAEEVRSVRGLVESSSKNLVVAVHGSCPDDEELGYLLPAPRPNPLNVKIMRASAEDLWEVLRDHTSEFLMSVQVEAQARCVDLISDKILRMQVETDAKYTQALNTSVKRLEATTSVANALSGNLQRLEAEMRELQSSVQQCWNLVQRPVQTGRRETVGGSTSSGGGGRSKPPLVALPSPQGPSQVLSHEKGR